MPPTRLADACSRSLLAPRRVTSSGSHRSSDLSFARLHSRSYTLAPASSAHSRNAFAPLRTPRLASVALRSPLAPSRLVQRRLQSNLADTPPIAADPFDLPEQPLDIPSDDRHVGFLLENYGIDFGWGTSSIMKTVFESIHCDLGTEFWASILITGLALRLLCMPFNRSASNTSAQLQALSSIVKPLQTKSTEAAARKDMAEMQKYRGQVSAIYKEAGVNPLKMAYSFVQVPVGFGCWRTFSNMAAAPVDGLSTGGVLWFPNLAISDPLFILPIATCLTQYLSMRSNTESNPSLTPGQLTMQKLLMYGLPCVFFPIIVWAPAAIQLHFLTTASFSGLMNLGFRSSRVRSLLRMAPRVQAAAPASSNAAPRTINVSAASRVAQANSSSRTGNSDAPAKGMLGKFRSRMANAQKSVMDSISDVVPGSSPLKDRQKSAAASKASAYESKRSQEIAKERLAYEQQLQSYRMDTKRTKQ